MRKLHLLLICMGLFLQGCNSMFVDEPYASIDNPTLPVSANAVNAPHYSYIARPMVDAAVIPAEEFEETATAPTDIWERIRTNLTLPRHLSHSTTQSRLKFYSGKQDYFDRVTDRATPYLHYIVEELEKRNMPLDLALLPIVESAYNPFAQSRSRAMGIWQFIPGTGKRFGLKQNWWYDGRRDIVAATDAALDYLQELHREFNGDWLLAVAAYNTGELNIARAIEKNRKAGKPANFWSLQLHKETMGYVPSLLAVAEVVANPAKYKLVLKPVPNQPYVAIIKTGGQIDLATVAQLSDLNINEVYLLNPGFNRWATDPDGPHYLLLPSDRVESFREKLAALPDEERLKWKTYEVRHGDTIGHIASLYHMDISSLKRINNLKSNTLRAGHKLIIPASRKPLQEYTLSEDFRNISNLQRSGDGQRLTYVIKSGDTLWDISNSYGISVDQVCAWNSIEPEDVLRPGTQLVVWSGAGVVPVVEKVAIASDQKQIKYTVQEGDSLWLIAKRFGVSVKQIQHWNSLSSTRLQPGQILDIYTGKPPADV